MKAVLILFLSILSIVAGQDIICDEDEIRCADNSRCIPYRFICDSDDDCSDELDEDSDLCEAWRNDDCDKNFARCTRDGTSSCIEISDYCSTETPPCEGELDRRLCVMIESGQIGSLSQFVVPPLAGDNNLNQSQQLADKFKRLIPNTISGNNCPSMYTSLGDQCISFFHFGSMSWGEAREFCRFIDGDLITFRNVSQYAAIVQHIQRHELTSDFWIGGRIQNVTEGWFWIDETPMEVGSPFWATRYSSSCIERNATRAPSDQVCYHYYQTPEATPKGHCASLSFEHFFFMSDEDCLRKMSPICVYQGKDYDYYNPIERFG